MDMGGPFSWQELSPAKLLEIRGKLAELEANTWHEILVDAKHRNHTVLVYRLSPQAKNRLRKIKQDDLDELTSLRLSGRERVWGIRENGILHLLWWDPEHRVCPAALRHT